MENLFICHISERYISFLHSRDFRVPFNKGQRRPYVGVVLTVGSFRYFVPMESPKPNHANLKPGKHILKLDGGRLGLLGSTTWSLFLILRSLNTTFPQSRM